jgi:hypothetical protein
MCVLNDWYGLAGGLPVECVINTVTDYSFQLSASQDCWLTTIIVFTLNIGNSDTQPTPGSEISFSVDLYM